MFDSLSSEKKTKLLEKYLKDFGGYALFQLASQCRRKLIGEFAITNGVDVNVKGLNGRTPLHDAVAYNEHRPPPSFLAWLLDNPLVDVNRKDICGRTPLHIAVKENDKWALKQLLASQRLVPNIPDNSDYLPLHYTCLYHRHYTASRIASWLMDDIWKRRNETTWNLLTNRHGKTILHLAAQAGHAELVNEMLSHKIHINLKLFPIDQQNKFGATALFIAADQEHVELCKCLIAHGACVEVAYKHEHEVDSEANTRAKSTLLLCAIRCNDVSVLQLRDDLGSAVTRCMANNETHVHEAVRYNKNRLTSEPSILKRLLQSDRVKRLWNNATSIIGTTPLHVAVQMKDESAVTQLLACEGIRASMANYKQELSLHYACLYYSPNVARLLMDDIWLRKDLNSDLELHWDLLSSKSVPILHYAVISGHTELVAQLLEHKIYTQLKLFDINQKNQNGQSALFVAAKHGHSEIFRYLLEHGASADADVCDVDGRSLLYETVLSGDAKLTEALFSNQKCHNLADFPTSKAMHLSRLTKRALHMACRLGRIHIVRYIIENHSIQLDLSDNMPSFLSVAIKHNHKPVVKYIIEESFLWTQLLSKHFLNENGTRDTPMRQLLRCMPDVALAVLDKCKKKNERDVTYYYCFCDDDCTARIPYGFPKTWNRKINGQAELDLDQLGRQLLGYYVSLFIRQLPVKRCSASQAIFYCLLVTFHIRTGNLHTIRICALLNKITCCR